MKIVERVTRLEAIMPEISEKLTSLDTKIDGLDHIIRGNGSPGLAAKVESVTGTQRLWRDLIFTVLGGITVGVVLSMFNSWSVSHVNKNMPAMQQKP